ncbi:MAG TPA: hypothetical protein VD866_01255 [Urbifossiella sp.]|nr:hypothetical protein [Urbifossiella sp.]
MDRHSITETVEEWHLRVTCSAEEAPAIAAAIPKAIAGMTRCYQPDVVHVHQALQAAAEAQALPRYSRPSLTHTRN